MLWGSQQQWVDSRVPHGPLDPPVKGKFEKGIGTFYSDYLDQGKPMRVRFIWSHITPTSARWEQAASADAGKTWDTNWVNGIPPHLVNELCRVR